MPSIEEWGERHRVRLGIRLACAVAEGDLDRFQEVVRGAGAHRFGDETEHLESGIEALARYPALRGPLGRLFPRQPERCARILQRLGLVERLGPGAVTPLADLETDTGTADAGMPGDDPRWNDLLALAPELEPLAQEFLHAQRLLGRSLDVPPGVRRALELPYRLAGELEYLERRVEAEPGREDLRARAASLRDRLGDRERLERAAREEVRERLDHAAAEARLGAVEEKIVACYRSRLRQITGPAAAEVPIDDDLLNAILLTVDIRQNRRLLRRLIRAHLAGETGWRERLPQNAAFVAALAERGVDVEAWLAAHPRRYASERAAGGRLRLRLERDPIRILQMGNHFDTCLSFGQCNAYSTVANASELNKRVVFATDGSGRVVGRKLIGLDVEGRLVGFRTYTSLPDEAGNRELVAIFRHYLRGFAARCGLELIDCGAVPRLLAEAWYDDGSVPWGGEEESSVSGPGGYLAGVSK